MIPFQVIAVKQCLKKIPSELPYLDISESSLCDTMWCHGSVVQVFSAKLRPFQNLTFFSDQLAELDWGSFWSLEAVCFL